jgi:hypothetical protein
MTRLSFTASVLVSLLRSVGSSLLTFLSPSWDGPVRKYRPEDHYMRGPGPKWREKHFLIAHHPLAARERKQGPVSTT